MRLWPGTNAAAGAVEQAAFARATRGGARARVRDTDFSDLWPVPDTPAVLHRWSRAGAGAQLPAATALPPSARCR